MKLKNCKKDIDSVLSKVTKPITYTGNEIGSVHKEEKKDELTRFAFAFPDTYEVGMSHLGMKILYSLLNERDDVWCERVFAPWSDMEEVMMEKGIPLYALESMDPVKNFDFLGFSLQYEMSYTNVLNMLALAHIPLLAKDRDEDDPIIIAGGPCAFNPEPLVDFIDIFAIGEMEEALPKLLDLYEDMKKKGKTKKEFLREAAKMDGFYVPSLYEVRYNDDGTIRDFKSVSDDIPDTVRRVLVEDYENAYYPTEMIVPFSETVHDRVSYEVMRGCPRGCRFCQAGQIYRPVRKRSQERIKHDVGCLVESTGFDEVSLSSLSSGDYPQIENLIHDLVQDLKEDRVSVNLPSLRIDSVSIDMLEEMQEVRKGGITLAPEAGSQRMRDVINKGVSEEDLIATVTPAFEKGWGNIKLYFMIGLPTETDEDIKGIYDLANKVVDAYFSVPKEKRNRSCQVTISTSCFVPKPFTPFQWFGQNTRDEFTRKQKYLKSEVKNRKVRYNWHDGSLSFLEAVFARGDRRLGPVLLRAHELGCRFDGWADHFDMDKWMQAFEDTGVDPDWYALRERNFDEVLPWDFIDIGVSKDFFIMEYLKSQNEQLSRNCIEGCENCGIMQFVPGWKCHAADKTYPAGYHVEKHRRLNAAQEGGESDGQTAPEV